MQGEPTVDEGGFGFSLLFKETPIGFSPLGGGTSPTLFSGIHSLAPTPASGRTYPDCFRLARSPCSVDQSLGWASDHVVPTPTQARVSAYPPMPHMTAHRTTTPGPKPLPRSAVCGLPLEHHQMRRHNSKTPECANEHCPSPSRGTRRMRGY